jgi:hypothetical protein
MLNPGVDEMFLSIMGFEIKLGKYRHFKGMIVEVIGVALHSETKEEMVIYNHPDPVKGEGANTLWARPLEMFLETIERDGKVVKRFEKVED